MILAALHCHCLQLLAQARDLLPPQACTLGGQQERSRARGSCSSSAGSRASSAVPNRQSSHPQLNCQRQAWQAYVSQLQHNLLLVLTLTRQWQQGSVRSSAPQLLKNKLQDSMAVTFT